MVSIAAEYSASASCAVLLVSSLKALSVIMFPVLIFAPLLPFTSSQSGKAIGLLLDLKTQVNMLAGSSEKVGRTQ